MSKENKTLSLLELSRAIGRGENTVRRYVSEGLPYVQKGDRGRAWGFDLEAVRKWIKARDQTRGAVDPELTRQRARLTKLNADRKELLLRQERGQLLRVDLAQSLWAGVIQNMVNKLEALPSKIAPMLQGLSIPEMKAKLDRAIYEVRQEMSNPNLKEVAENMNKNKTIGGKRK